MNFIQVKYSNLLSSYVRNFSKKSSVLYNFSCPLCGDSKTNNKKARGYIYENENGRFSYKCWNCGVTLSFGKFLRNIDVNLHKQYVYDTFQEKREEQEQEEKEKIEPRSILLDNHLDKVTKHNNALVYLKNRQIPEQYFDQMYYCDNLDNIKCLFSDKYQTRKFYPEPRIILPIYSINKQLIGITARSIKQNTKLRYVVFKIDSDDPMIFGLERVNLSESKFVVEGAFDSLFLTNCIAVDGSTLVKASDYIDKDKDILIYDMDYRNPDLMKQLKKAAKNGYKLCIWPNYLKKYGKDINEFVLNGITPKQLEDIIRKHSFSGLNLQFEIAKLSV